jgi:hypothetical protein
MDERRSTAALVLSKPVQARRRALPYGDGQWDEVPREGEKKAQARLNVDDLMARC